MHDAIEAPVSSGPLRYSAFLSHSHKDTAIAHRLARALERFRIPAQLRGRACDWLPTGEIGKNLGRVFRDRDETRIAADLDAVLTEALARSGCLIVMCSPAAMASRWVLAETAEFRRIGRGQRILPVIVGLGDDEPIPVDLLNWVVQVTGQPAPLSADLRRSGDGWQRTVVMLVAAILGTEFDDLWRRHARHRRMRLLAATSLSLLAGSLLVFAAWQAQDHRLQAIEERALQHRLRGDSASGLQLIAETIESAPGVDLLWQRTGRRMQALAQRLWMDERVLAHWKLGDELVTRVVAHPTDDSFTVGDWAGALYRLEPVRRKLVELAQLGGPVSALAYTPDGKRVAAGSLNGRVLVIESETGRILDNFERDGQVHSLLFLSADTLASIFNDGQVEQFDLQHSRRIDASTSLGSEPSSVATDSQRKFVAVADRSNKVRILDSTLNQVKHELSSPIAKFEHVRLGSNDRRLLTDSAEGGLAWWHIPADAPYREGGGGPDSARIEDVALDDKHRLALAAGRDGRLHFWNLETRGYQRTIPLDALPLRAVAIGASGQLALAGGEKGRLWLLRTSVGQTLRSASPRELVVDFSGRPAAVSRVGSVYELSMLDAESAPIGLKLMPAGMSVGLGDSKLLMSGHVDGQVCAESLLASGGSWCAKVLSRRVDTIARDEGGQWLAVAAGRLLSDDAAEIALLSLSDGRIAWQARALPGRPQAIGFVPGAALVWIALSRGTESTVALIRTSDGSMVTQFETDVHISDVVLDRDSGHLIVATMRSLLQLRMEDLTLVARLPLSGQPASRLAIGPGHCIVVGSNDGTLRIHNRDLSLVSVLRGPDSPISWLGRDADDLHVTAVGRDGSVMRWPVPCTPAAVRSALTGSGSAVRSR